MKIVHNTARMDPLLMTRSEVANVPLIARNDLSLSETLAAAGNLDKAILSQFPDVDDRERVKIARDLAQQLGDPRPYLVANVMRSFYARKNQADSTPPGEGGAGEPQISRGRNRPAQQR